MNEEVIEKIEEAFRLISSIYVRQNDVEVMAMAKAHLREAYKAAGGKKEEKSDG